MSKGQTDLLRAALRSRQQAAAEHQRNVQRAEQLRDERLEEARGDVEDTEPVEQREEVVEDFIAGPITSPADIRPQRSFDLQIRELAEVEEDEIPMASPLTDAPQVVPQEKKFQGNLLEHPSIRDTLLEHFGKVQCGEDRVVVYGALSHLADKSNDELIDFIRNIIIDQDFDAQVLAGNREGRFRIVTV